MYILDIHTMFPHTYLNRFRDKFSHLKFKISDIKRTAAIEVMR